MKSRHGIKAARSLVYYHYNPFIGRSMVELDANKMYGAFAAGAVMVIDKQEHLNRINVFPVPDGDTGTNLAATLFSMTQASADPASAGLTISAMADAALLGARGNSGIIFAQFLAGFCEKVRHVKTITIEHFIQAMEHAAESAAAAMSKPCDGTMLSVIRDWAAALRREATKAASFIDLFHKTIPAAEESLRKTPEQLDVLKKAGVVDAGALGFVEFIKGAGDFIASGKQASLDRVQTLSFAAEHAASTELNVNFRYCTETMLRGSALDPAAIRLALRDHGDNLIVAGGGSLARVHIHTNDPARVIDMLRAFGNPIQQKVDDMKAQMEILGARERRIALLTDSTCDLPRELMDRYKIQAVPIVVSFGEAEYLDRVTLTTERFFELAEGSPVFPKTSQPPGAAFQRAFSFLSSYYDSVVAIHLSSRLSGTYETSLREAAKFPGKKITVIDSRHLSGSLGLIVLRAARAIEQGLSHEEVVAEVMASRHKSEIFVGVPTLKYMVRGGRVSPLKGIAARLLNLKPIVSMDKEGRSVLYGKAFSLNANKKRIVRMVKDMEALGPLSDFAVVHGSAPEAARALAGELELALGKPATYVMSISPVVGLNAGPGTVAAVAIRE